MTAGTRRSPLRRSNGGYEGRAGHGQLRKEEYRSLKSERSSDPKAGLRSSLQFALSVCSLMLARLRRGPPQEAADAEH